jgi:hypothetical protein
VVTLVVKMMMMMITTTTAATRPKSVCKQEAVTALRDQGELTDWCFGK